MTSRPTPVHLLMKRARLDRGMTQVELAKRAGCHQSALSAYESGIPRSLSQEVIGRLAQELEVDLDAAAAAAAEESDRRKRVPKYCPRCDCPSNIPYVVGGELRFRPRAVAAPAAEDSRCAWCGGPLRFKCLNDSCGAAVRPGVACPRCGGAYVENDLLDAGSPAKWADRQRARIRDVFELSGEQVDANDANEQGD